MTTFVADVSACQNLAGHDNRFIVLPLGETFVNRRDFSWCHASGKCAILVNDYGYNLLLSLVCTLYPRRLIQSPAYISPTLGRLNSGYIFNKKMPKDQRTRISGYIQRSFEMGLEKKNGPLSKDFGTKTSRSLTQLDANEECMSKKIRNSISTPASLSNEFFRNCYRLYSCIVMIAVAIHLFAQCNVQFIKPRD